MSGEEEHTPTEEQQDAPGGSLIRFALQQALQGVPAWGLVRYQADWANALLRPRSLRLNEERRRFLNPVIQNEGRTRALQQVVPNVPVANLVVCTGKVEFTTTPPANVIRVSELDSYIQKFVFGPSKVKDWDSVWMNVKSAARTDEATRRDLQAQVGFG